MPNNNSDAHHDREGEKNEFFASLLTFLCPEDRDEASKRYLRLHQKLTGYFRLKGMYDPVNDADDALDRAAEKIVKGHQIPDIDKFCIGIARNIVHERLRHKKREESAFLKFLDHSQDNSTETLVDRITNLMRPCFEQLPQEDRDLLTSYCQVPRGVDRAEHRRQLAARLKSTISALRIRVTRLRRGLENCVKALSKKR
jgi:DNA-directed RNA polymerase specialized sigma24 family protein